MTRDGLRALLRRRADALAPPAVVIDRALARCARIGVRQGSGRQASVPSLPTVAASAATVVSAAPGAPAPVTVPSLGAAPTAPPPAGQLAVGTIIAGYRIEGLLGKGGMGSVYRATQLSMSRLVAFKVLAPRYATDPTFVGRFKREARAAGRLHHHHVVTVHDAGEADSLVFFSMELVEGRSLKELLRERGRLPPAEALHIARQVLEALAYAHAKAVVHRDIKPDNILLKADGTVKVADLGLSRIDERQVGDTTELFQTGDGSFMGTPHYMAPEQGRDAHAADHRCDLYALGATLYHLVCGRQPFTGLTPMEVLLAAQTQPLTWPDPAPPAVVREVLAALMAKAPDQRPPDADAAMRLIDRALATVSPPPALAAPRPRWLRRLAVAGLVMAAVAAMVVLAMAKVREHHADLAWNATLAAAERDLDAHRHAEALAGLYRARAAMPDGSARAAACDAAIARAIAAWDAWAGERTAGLDDLVRAHLDAGRYQEALARLREVPESWRSPAVEARLNALHRQWEEAVARDAERKPAGDGRGPLLAMLAEHRQRVALALWARSSFAPDGAARQHDGAIVFTGSGSGTIPFPEGQGLAGGLHLRLALTGTGATTATWTLQVARDLAVTIGRDGAVAMVRGRQVPLPGGADGDVSLSVMRRGSGWVLASAEGTGTPLILPLPDGTSGAMHVRWSIPDGALTLRLGGRR